jgi:hypothetical protein
MPRAQSRSMNTPRMLPALAAFSTFYHFSCARAALRIRIRRPPLHRAARAAGSPATAVGSKSAALAYLIALLKSPGFSTFCHFSRIYVSIITGERRMTGLGPMASFQSYAGQFRFTPDC